MKLPHWAALAMALGIVVIGWIMNQAASGQLVLPATVLTVLTVLKTALQMFSDTPSKGGPPSAQVKQGPGPTITGDLPKPPPAAARTRRNSGAYRIFPFAFAAAALMLACQAVAPAVDCGGRILVDASKGMTLAQIYADVVGPCGADIAAILSVLLESKDPAVTTSTAYGEAVKIRAAMKAAP